MATQYFFVSSYGREGPYDSAATANGRAATLALRAALDGRDRECPRIEATDGTCEVLAPFGSHLYASDFEKLPAQFNPVLRREREAAEFVAQCADTMVERMEEHVASETPVTKDPAAKAIRTWALRRAILVLLRQLPETRALAREFEARWYAPE